MNKKSFKFSLPSILAGIKKIPWILGRCAFSVVLILIAIDLILGVMLVYNYIFAVEASQPQTTESPSTFKSDIYKGILKEWQVRDQKLQNNQFQGVF